MYSSFLSFQAMSNKTDNQQVSSTGGWCAQTSRENSGQHKTDTKLVPVLAEFLKGNPGRLLSGCRFQRIFTKPKLSNQNRRYKVSSTELYIHTDYSIPIYMCLDTKGQSIPPCMIFYTNVR